MKEINEVFVVYVVGQRSYILYKICVLCHFLKLRIAFQKTNTSTHSVTCKHTHTHTTYMNQLLYLSCLDMSSILNCSHYLLVFPYSWMTDEQLRLLAPSLVEGRPNTYTFTKALAENLLRDEAGDIPVSIIRPSIIGATVNEPIPVSDACVLCACVCVLCVLYVCVCMCAVCVCCVYYVCVCMCCVCTCVYMCEIVIVVINLYCY